jgi:carbon starvation protein CstA
VSGFHALISSGTTPKMLENESHARFIGYGGMLAESFVAVMALAAASVIDPGVYFAMNAPAALVGSTPEAVAQTLSTWGFVITPTCWCRPPRTWASTPSWPAPVAHPRWRWAWPTSCTRWWAARP